MAVNLVATLDGLPISSTHCWLDSSVALYWIRGQVECKQFVSNWVQKISSHQGVVWHHVPTADNPADLGSGGGSAERADLCWDTLKYASRTSGDGRTWTFAPSSVGLDGRCSVKRLQQS